MLGFLLSGQDNLGFCGQCLCHRNIGSRLLQLCTPCPHDNHNSNYSLSTWQPQLKLLPVHTTTTNQITPCPHDHHKLNQSLSTWQPRLKWLPVHMTTTTYIIPCLHAYYNWNQSLSTPQLQPDSSWLIQLKSGPVHTSTTTGLKLTNSTAYLSHWGVTACGAVHFLSQVTAAWNNTATAFKGVYSLLHN